MKKFFPKEAIWLALLIGVFAAISILSDLYLGELTGLIGTGGLIGIAVFLFLVILSEVISPISVLPIFPIAVGLWGENQVIFLSVLGWMAGSIIAFWLARYFGQPLIGKIANLKKIEKFGASIRDKNLFFLVIVLRLALPVDLASYSLGLFTKMRWLPYLAATFLGTLIFAYLAVKAVVLPMQWQIILALTAILIILIFYRKIKDFLVGWIER